MRMIRYLVPARALVLVASFLLPCAGLSTVPCATRDTPSTTVTASSTIALGTGMQVLTSIFGVDLPGDIRDNWHNLTHWSEVPTFQKIMDVVALLPAVGALKYADEVRDLLKGGSRVAKTTPPVNVLPSSDGKFIVDPKGSVLPLKPGETFTSSPNAQWIQVRDAAGNPTGLRLDGPHPPRTHPDLRAQVPHGHVPGVTNPDGTPWLPVNP